MFEEMMAENVPNLVKNESHKFRRHKESQARRTQTGPPLRDIIIKMPKIKQKENFKGSKNFF